jgi:hypothetical protein
MKIPLTYKLTLAALLAAIAILCPKPASANDELDCYWRTYRWNLLDGNYQIRQAQRLSDILDRENRERAAENTQRRLNRFLLDEGY